MSATVSALYVYPVKGLSPQPLDRVRLEPGRGLPHDRRFAIARSSSRIDPANPQWQPKTSFLMLMRDEKLAQLTSRFDPETGELLVERKGKPVVHAKITEAMGRTVIGQFFAAFMGDAVRGAPKVVEARDEAFTDQHRPLVSIVNLASVNDLERVAGRQVDPLRFRANVYVDGLAPWEEMQWPGAEVMLGGARLSVVKNIDRCAATEVNPATGERDLNVPRTLERGFGHVRMGVYGEVVKGGDVAKGDALRTPEAVS